MQHFERMLAAANSLTPDQIDACNFAMGDGANWTKETIIEELEHYKKIMLKE